MVLIAGERPYRPKPGNAGGPFAMDKEVYGIVEDAVRQAIGENGFNVPEATALAKGIIQLAGDLGGTAAAPEVPGLDLKADASAMGSATTNFVTMFNSALA